MPADPTRPPSAPGRHRRIRLSAVLLSVAVLLVACTSGSARSSGGSKVDLRTGTPARLALPDGASVEVPAGAVGSPGELTGRTTGAPAPAPTGTVLGSKVYDFTGPAPAAPVTVTLPVAPAVFSAATPAGAPPPSVAALAFFDAPSGSWQLVPARYDPAARTISAATPHLSLWTVLRVDTGRLAGLAGRALNNYLGAANVAQPDCPGDQQLRAVGVRVSSDSGDLVKWCAGSRDGRSLVRVANNRDYAMEVDYPPGWTATRLGDSDAVLDRIVAGLAGHMTAPLGGQQSLVLGGGRVVELVDAPGSSGQVNVSPSPGAYLVDAFLYGVDTFGMTLGDFPGAPKTDPRLTVKVLDAALTTKDCMASLDKLTSADVSSAGGVFAAFRADVDVATGCLGSAWGIGYGYTGAVGALLVGAATWLADGVKLVVDGLRAAVETGLYWRNYRIAVEVPAPRPSPAPAPSPAVPSFVGEWHVHGSALSITSTTAGHSVSNDGPCGAADNYGIPGLPMCQEKDEFRFRLSPDGRTLTGTVASAVIVEATTGKARPDRPTGANPGETFTLAFAAPNLLISDPPSVGNPYLCNTQTSKADLPKCGA